MMRYLNAKGHLGMTLIELLIVVVLISTILGISIPGYRQYAMRANRADATTALLRIAAAQERFYMQNGTYAGFAQLSLAPPAGLGFPGNTSERGFYNLAVAPHPGGLAVGYTAAAIPAPGGNQTDDTDCGVFTINESGTKVSAPSPMDTCWR